MKKIVTPIVALLLTGCAFCHSTTKSYPTPGNTNTVTVVTKTTIYTLFDANSQLTKYNVRGTTVQSNQWAQGTYIGQLGQNSTSTNLAVIIGEAVGIAVKAAGVP
jgi:hypothetical protein